MGKNILYVIDKFWTLQGPVLKVYWSKNENLQESISIDLCKPITSQHSYKCKLHLKECQKKTTMYTVKLFT